MDPAHIAGCGADAARIAIDRRSGDRRALALTLVCAAAALLVSPTLLRRVTIAGAR